MKTEISELRQIVKGEVASISTNNYSDTPKYHYILLYEQKNGNLDTIKIKTEKPNNNLKGKCVEFDCIVYLIKGKLYRTEVYSSEIKEEKKEN